MATTPTPGAGGERRRRADAERSALASLEPLMERGQLRGSFGADAPAAWHLAMLLALIHAASGELRAGRLPPAQVEAALVATVLGAVASWRRTGERSRRLRACCAGGRDARRRALDHSLNRDYAGPIDFTLFKALNDFAAAHDGLVEDPLRFFALNAQYGFVALLAAMFLVTGKWRSVNGRHGVVAAGFSALLALGAAHFIAELWARPRPYEVHPAAHLFIAPSHDPSFPSDHATAAFAIAVALFLRHRTAGWIAIVMATILAVARVAVGTHYPADVAAGGVMGAAAALVLWHPSVRGPLHRLAEWAGRICERLLGSLRAGATAVGSYHRS
jgi:undecaprenyl-diphosphatase